MSMPTPPMTLGVEEEYQIIDPKTRNLHSYISEFLSQDKQAPGHPLHVIQKFAVTYSLRD